MENETVLALTGYVVTGITLLAAFMWIGLRTSRSGMRKLRVEDQTSRYAQERLQAGRSRR